MPKSMTLLQIIVRLSECDREEAIYAPKPWTEGSKAIVALEPLEGGLPAEALQAGYFLLIGIAGEVVEGWIDYLGFDPAPSPVCGRVIQYAINDT